MSKALAAQNKKIADNIEKHGWHCLHIAPREQSEEAFSYSIGFAQSFDAPEVLIFGLPSEKARVLLSACATVLRQGHTIISDTEDSELLSGGYKVVFKMVRSEFFGEYLGTAQRYYQNKRFEAAVMFLPDAEHRFPWHPGYNYIPVDEALSIV